MLELVNKKGEEYFSGKYHKHNPEWSEYPYYKIPKQFYLKKELLLILHLEQKHQSHRQAAS